MTKRAHPSLSLACFVAFAGPTLGQASGTVLDASTMTPLGDAIVSVQATPTRTTTAPDGTFDLPLATGAALPLVAAKKGYFNASTYVSTPTSGVTLLLQPVPVHTSPLYRFVEPDVCGSCHPAQRDQWVGSPMSLAGRNTWVYDIYDGTGSPGGLGGFVYKRDSHFAASNPESECASCHQPEPWIETPFTALEDIANPSAGALHGISCEVCHKVAHVDETKVNYPGIYPGAVDFRRPEPGTGQVQYGVLGDSNIQLPSLMRSSYQPQLTAAVCASCHQDKNDPDEDGDFEEPNGVISEPTYLEWLNSPYADPDSGVAATCVDCHMPAYGATQVATYGAPPQRAPETIRSHSIEGTTPEFLENAVEMTMDSDWIGSTLSVDVAITNSLTGHHVPTGVTVRNMILVVEAFSEPDGTPLVFTGTQKVHALGGATDGRKGGYAGWPGKLYAKLNHDRNGNGPTFFTDATGIQWDNRIPALATDATSYTFEVPSGTTSVGVKTRLIYRRAFRDLVLAKGWTTDGHGNPLADVTPPHYGHLMEELELRVEPGLVFHGCGPNPPYSLTRISGSPSIGTTLTLGVDNPLGTQTPGSLTFLYLSLAPHTSFPCGAARPGFGMAGPGAEGELLIELARPSFLTTLRGPAWLGASSPAAVPVAIPPDPGLVGLDVYTQGLVVDPGAMLGVRFGATEGMRFTIGP